MQILGLYCLVIGAWWNVCEMKLRGRSGDTRDGCRRGGRLSPPTPYQCVHCTPQDARLLSLSLYCESADARIYPYYEDGELHLKMQTWVQTIAFFTYILHYSVYTSTSVMENTIGTLISITYCAKVFQMAHVACSSAE